MARIVVFAALAGASALTSVQAQAPQGNVAVSRSRGDAMVIWDATGELSDLVAAKASKNDVLERIESDAALIFAAKAPRLRKTAKTLSVVVLYTKTGAVSPTYHVATFEGVERLLVLKARATANARDWAGKFSRGTVPSGASVTLTGQLPPELH
ncbi:MAG: hypothetical protein M3Y18_09610 [Candidatus Eremiobacteraeota bacterium]|nr:hypothetical protein [Candidatus Eremiobacteraeota bacterium]